MLSLAAARRWMAALSILCLGIALAGPAFAQEEADLDDPMERGRAATGWFYDGELQKILDLGVTGQMQEAIPDLEAWQRVHDQVAGQLGDEIEVLDETVTEAQGMQVYLRTVHFAQTGNRPVVVQWAFDPEGRIAGFYVRPQQQ